MRLILCDDDPIFMKQFSDRLGVSFALHGEKPEIVLCNSNRDIFDEIAFKATDALFLDIEMPGMNGFAIAEQLLNMQSRPIVIFTSSLDNLVFQSFTYQPFWFLRKEHMEELPQVVKRIVQLHDKQYYYLTANGKQLRFDLSQITYFESEGHYIVLHTEEESQRYKGKLCDIESQFKSQFFVRCHIGFLVNCRFIKMIERTNLTLTSGEQLPVSRSKQLEMQKRFLEYMRSLQI